MASYQAQHIQFEHWTSQEVANWLQGLDESVAQYVPLFQVHAVTGKRLLMLNHEDLEKMGVNKLGHQELILEAVDLLRCLRYTMDVENLQSMALQLGCKARNLITEIQMRQGENDQNRANVLRAELTRKRLSITVLSYVADLLATLKNLVSWLDRAPFEGIYDICRLRNSVVKLGLDLVTVTQRESSYVDPEEAIIKASRTLIEYCDGLVRNTKDPLVIQPAALEQATIRKKQGEELGMNIQSAYNGIHGISSIKDLSPADMCSKIEKGDEVLQVNGQTVLGWQLKELVKILKDKPKEVTLLLKKRPRHVNPLGAMQNHKKLAAKHAQQAATLPKSLKKRRSREGDGKQARPSLQEYASTEPTSDTIFVTQDAPDTNDADGKDSDNDVFRSGSESPQYTLPVMPDAKQRRATVSGGSPTFERNSLMVEDPVIRPKSQAINPAERDAALAILAASENNLKGRATLDEAAKGGNTPVLRKTSSESSSGQKQQSESEMEDSVFSSDKEDKEQQQTGAPKRDGAEVKRQEFRVTKPTPMLLEPTSANIPPTRSPVRRTSSSSSASTGGRPLEKPAVPPRKPSLTSKASKERPPSPLSAPPKRKKSLTSSLAREGDGDGGGDGKNVPEQPVLVVVRPTPVAAAVVSDVSKTVTVTSSPADNTVSGGGTGGAVNNPLLTTTTATTQPAAVPASSMLRKPDTITAPPVVAASPSSARKTDTLVEGLPATSLSRKQESPAGVIAKSGTPSSGVAGTASSLRKPDNPAMALARSETPPVVVAVAVTAASSLRKTETPAAAGAAGAKLETLAVNNSKQVVRPITTNLTTATATVLPGSDKSQDDQSRPASVPARPEKGKPVVLEAQRGFPRDTRSQAIQLAIHTEVATDIQDKDAPQLMKIKKLDSPKATEGPNPLASEVEAEVTPKAKKRVEFSADSKEASPPSEVSYTHIVVGGVVQKIPVKETSSSDSPPVKMRQKAGSRRLDRRVSCKDLGKGDCEGWLYKRKEKDRTLAKHWSKRWCILKNMNMYYYKNKEELKAEGVIFLPAFQVSPAPSLKTKKYAFKVHNSGTTFYFASERQDDMSKWMNKMGLAAISFDTSHMVTTPGFIKPEPPGRSILGVANAYYSESEDEMDEGSQYGSALSLNSLSSVGSANISHPSPPVAKRGAVALLSDPGSLRPPRQAPPTASLKEGPSPQSAEDLHTVLMRSIHSQELTIDGVDRRKRRTRHLSSMLGASDGKNDVHVAKMRKLLALKRTLKVKELEITDIDRLLASPLTSRRLQDFVADHPDVES